MVEVRLLGPVEIVADGRSVELRRPQSRTVLAALAVEVGRPVSAAALVDRVWGDGPPKGAQSVLYSHITRLRAALGMENPLVRRPAGYVLQLDPEAIDLHRFRRLSAPSADPARLRAALDLWRGEPLAGVRGRWAENVRVAWRQQRLDAAVRWVAAEQQRDHDDQSIPAIRALLAEFPLAEPLAAALMRALSAAGRTAEAVACFAQVRDRLRDELGTDPGVELREVHTSLLRSGGVAPLPIHQLPSPVAGFTGRQAALAALDGMLGTTGRSGGSSTEQRRVNGSDQSVVVISAISGTAGIGKTALALHWSHRVARHFPDGQLYVNLNGFDPAGDPMEPSVALRHFLGALGTPPGQIPDDLAAQAALYRSQLAGRRILVLLDNARDPEQVRPLLPGSADAFTVVTSRNWLTSLVAVEGASPLTLDLMSVAEATALLERRLGNERLEPTATRLVIDRCARLPLALSIAAARALQSGEPLRLIAEELAGQRWDTLDAGDPLTRVRTVFSWSYRALSPAAARLFRLLGRHPGPDFSVAAAAALAAAPVAQAQGLLAELTRASLTSEHRPGRYGWHDLLAAYAAELGPDEPQALQRLLDHHIRRAYAADRQLDPTRDPMPIPAAETQPPARDWLEQEHLVLLALQRRAAETGHHRQAWQLAWCLDTFLHRQGRWHERAHAWHVAADTGQEPAHAYLSLGRAENRLNRHADAELHLGRALELFAHDTVGRAHTHRALASLSERRGDMVLALAHDQQALKIFGRAGHRQGEADALNSVGWDHSLMGDHEAALEVCSRALALHQLIGDRWGEATTWDSLGHAHHHLERHGEATDCYGRALTLVRDLGDRYFEANTLTRLGSTYRDANNHAAARDAWQQALDILTELDHRDADEVRAKLAALP